MVGASPFPRREVECHGADGEVCYSMDVEPHPRFFIMCHGEIIQKRLKGSPTKGGRSKLCNSTLQGHAEQF